MAAAAILSRKKSAKFNSLYKILSDTHCIRILVDSSVKLSFVNYTIGPLTPDALPFLWRPLSQRIVALIKKTTLKTIRQRLQQTYYDYIRRMYIVGEAPIVDEVQLVGLVSPNVDDCRFVVTAVLVLRPDEIAFENRQSLSKNHHNYYQ